MRPAPSHWPLTGPAASSWMEAWRAGCFPNRTAIAGAFVSLYVLSLMVALVTYEAYWGHLPQAEDAFVAATLLAPIAQPLAAATLLGLPHSPDPGLHWILVSAIYWPVMIGFAAMCFGTRRIWAFGVCAMLAIVGAPLWQIVGVGLY